MARTLVKVRKQESLGVELCKAHPTEYYNNFEVFWTNFSLLLTIILALLCQEVCKTCRLWSGTSYTLLVFGLKFNEVSFTENLTLDYIGLHSL